jgi:hypothetical protein
MSSKRLAVVTCLLLAGAAPPIGAEAQIVYPFPPYRAAMYDASVRLEVDPRDAEVFVDGYYAGVVDEFDGVWQRLRVDPGQHEIALYREGYRTYRQRVYLARDRTFRIKIQMEALAPGEAGEPRPTPTAPPAVVQPPRDLPQGSAPRQDPASGRISIRVQPADAEVLIDGQAQAITGKDLVVLDLSEGRHVIQVRKAGYIGYLSEVQVRRNETTTLSVNLRPQP